MRHLLLLALAALLVGVFAPAALAAAFTCNDSPCFGTRFRDVILEQVSIGAADKIHGRQGDDAINAAGAAPDVDQVLGNQGDDELITRDSDQLDVANGGKGDQDTCIIDSGDEAIKCEVLYVDGVLQP